MYDGEKATSERDRDRKRRARRMLCSGVHGSEELPKASDQRCQTQQRSPDDLREVRLQGAEEWQEVGHRDREMLEKSVWEVKVGEGRS